jgi:hypothetical protein
MNRKSGIRKILVAALLLVVLAAAFVVTLPTQDVVAASNCTYYSNASHTTIVGQFGYDCCNNPVAWGKKTAFKVCGGCFPCFPPPR